MAAMNSIATFFAVPLAAWPAAAALTPAVQWHLIAALGALLLGPMALWARKGSPRHRMAGYLWVVLMLAAALSSVFIRDFRLPNLAGYTPIHLLTVFTFGSLGVAMWAIWRRRINAHRRTMQGLYIGGCLVAGAFTLLPGRFLGQLLWRQTLGWM